MMKEIQVRRPKVAGVALALLGSAITTLTSVTVWADSNAPHRPSVDGGTSQTIAEGGAMRMPFATLGGGASSHANGTLIIVGQTLVGESFAAGYTMRVGAIDGLVPIRPGDFNRDRRVDLDDWNQLANCISGPGVPIGAACRPGDFDGDDHVDLEDVATYQRRLDSRE